MIRTPIITTGASGLTISVDPSYLSVRVTAASGTSTESVSLTIDGEVGSVTAVWSSDNANVSVTNPTSTSTNTFDYSGINMLEPSFATITVTVTDSIGRSATFNSVVTVTRIS